MRLSEKLEQIAVTLELFPRCARCGLNLASERIGDLVVPADRPRRFAHKVCPTENSDAA